MAGTAHLFQRRIPKVADVRVTVIGAKSFWVRIDSGLLDWRTDYSQLRYSPVEPPSGIEPALHHYMHRFGLVFGAFAQSLTRGLKDHHHRRLRQRTLDDKDGRRRTMMEIDVEDVAVSLTCARAQFTKTYRQGMPSQGGPAPTLDRTQPSSPAPAESHPF